MSEALMPDAAERQALHDELAALNIAVHQPDDRPLFTAQPKPAMQPCHWRAADISAMLERIGAHLKLEAGGNRRTLRLTNPGLPYGTTPTLWASIQYILPGEIATSHRHAASALRFVMQGSGTDTIVDGEQYVMNEGDLVLTPSMQFHDHEHRGDRPMVWLDVLDISLVRALEAVFFEPFPAARQDVQPGRPSARLAYGRELAEAALRRAAHAEPDPFDDTVFDYQAAPAAGATLPTIGTLLTRLRPGFRGRAHRHTGSAVYYIVRGQGATTIDGRRFAWARGDFIALPSWSAHAHENNSASDDALLFAVNDNPALKALGLWREEA
jgi:gentisate 1,2-dioxygenase